MQQKRKRTDEDDENDCDLDTSERAYMSDEEGGVRIEDIYIPPPPKLISNNQENGIRLIIHKIINTNFKSYGGTTVLGPFYKNFNAIVGPNGSGKSNVIDSMLFVFGYRASKIRSKKLSVLLHKSEKYPDVQSCTVAVQFILIKDVEGDPEAYEEIPNSKIEVARTVHKDNTSYYTLNGVRVQYREVASLLRKHGIDLDHNRFLILQGEVEQISLMKPKAPNEHETGMLEYLEDIIGTTRYKVPLAQLEEKIETLSEIRTEKLNRVKLAEREKEDLKEPMSEAVEFLKLENDITRNKNFIFQRLIVESERRIDKNQDEANEIKKVCEEMNQKLSAANDERKKMEQEFNSKNDKHDKLTKQKEKLTDEYDKINNRDLGLKENIVSTVTKRKKGKEQLKIEQKKLEELEKVPEKNRAKIEELQNRVEQLTEEIRGYEDKKESLLASLGAETAKFSEEKEQIQIKLAPLKEEYVALKNAYEVIDSELKIAQSKEHSEMKNLESLKNQFEENKQILKEKPKYIAELDSKIKNTEKQLNDAHRDLQKAQALENNKIQEIRNIKDEIEESKSSMRAAKSKNQIIDALMRQKRDGKMPGLFGRLGDLGAIDLKYDVAVSTACGPLDNIVVDTVATGTWGVDFLKKNGIGRATFIPLEKQEHLRQKANTRIQTPENVPRLFDLIKVEDERVKTAFYYALRDTLVANDLEQASRIAYGERRWRVVTLKGELIETSGTMSGGGKTVFRGRMGQSVAVHSKQVDPEKLIRMEKSLTELEQEVREYQNQQVKLNDQIRTLTGSLEKMRIDLNKSTYMLDSVKKAQEGLAEQIKKQEKLVKNSVSNPEVIKKLQAEANKKKQAYEKSEEKVNALQTKVESINKEIKNITEKKMGGIENKLKETKQVFEKCKKEISKLSVEISKSERQKVLCNDKIKDLDAERIAFEKSLQEMQAERQEIEKIAAELLEKIETVTRELKVEEKSFSGARKAIDELAKQIKEMKSEKIDIDVKLKDAEKKLNESVRELNHIKQKLKELSLQEIPDETVEELQTYTPEELFELDLKHINSQLKVQEEKLKSSKPNLTAIQEYKKKVKIYLDRVTELDEITEKRNMLRNQLEDARKRRLDEFHIGFKSISSKLKEMYQMITFGGDAELEMVDTYDPFSEGIVLNIRPPKKTWKNITNLSGGEKTLSSLALVFALHYYKPSPLYFMDEIDAALDFKNVSIVGNYIKERTKNAQFIIISLRNNMFELADLLVGIYKTENITKSVSLELQEFAAKYDRQHANRNVEAQRQQQQQQPEGESERLFDELQQNSTQNNDNRVRVAQNLRI